VGPEYVLALWERNHRTKMEIAAFCHKILVEIYGEFRRNSFW